MLHLIGSPRARCGRLVVTGLALVTAILSLWNGQVCAQESLRNWLTTDAAVSSQRRAAQSQPAFVKSGDFTLSAQFSLRGEYNDNVNTATSSSSGRQSDYILGPMLDLQASYPITQNNLFAVSFGIGYDHYINHDELSGLRLQAGSGLSFDMLIKDFRINLHDQVSYSRDASREPSIANTSQYGNIENTAGLSVVWDLADVVSTLGYNHFNSFSSSGDFSYQDRSSEMLLGRVGLHLHPTLTAGVESSGSFTSYKQKIHNDSSGCSVGVYGDWQPGRALHVQPRAGYSFYFFSQTSQGNPFGFTNQALPARDQGAWYVDLNITHDISDAVSYTLNLGHELRLGVQADAVDSWYARVGVSWKLIRELTLQPSFSYEHGSQGAGSFSEDYDWYTFGLGFRYQLAKKLSAGLEYRLTLRSSTFSSAMPVPGRGYTQNMITLTLSYQFQ
jgi:hypothetical protein